MRRLTLANRRLPPVWRDQALKHEHSLGPISLSSLCWGTLHDGGGPSRGSVPIFISMNRAV